MIPCEQLPRKLKVKMCCRKTSHTSQRTIKAHINHPPVWFLWEERDHIVSKSRELRPTEVAEFQALEAPLKRKSVEKAVHDNKSKHL